MVRCGAVSCLPYSTATTMSPLRFLCKGSRNKVLLWLILTVSGIILIVLHDVSNAVTTVYTNDRGGYRLRRDSLPTLAFLPYDTTEQDISFRKFEMGDEEAAEEKEREEKREQGSEKEQEKEENKKEEEKEKEKQESEKEQVEEEKEKNGENKEKEGMEKEWKEKEETEKEEKREELDKEKEKEKEKKGKERKQKGEAEMEENEGEEEEERENEPLEKEKQKEKEMENEKDEKKKEKEKEKENKEEEEEQAREEKEREEKVKDNNEEKKEADQEKIPEKEQEQKETEELGKKEKEGERKERDEEEVEEEETDEEQKQKEKGEEDEKEGERAEIKDGGDALSQSGSTNTMNEKSGLPRGPTIVYSCNLIQRCGGWADRQKGIVSAFVLSALLNARFKLDMPRPCDISTYLAPNEVDWVLMPGETDGVTRRDLEGIDSHGYDLVKQMLLVDDLQMPQLQADYVFITWNMELVHQLRTHPLARKVPWLSVQMSIAEIYHHVLNKLFKPVPALEARLSSLQNSRPVGTKLACAQIRLGGSAEFPDTQTFNTLSNVRKVLDHLRSYNDPARYRILFASDNVQALKMAKEAFPRTFMETSGPITHVDQYQGHDACAGLGRAILDQLILSACDVLVISESGLGKIAAFLRNSDDDLFLFHDSRISRFRRDLSFPHRVFW